MSKKTQKKHIKNLKKIFPSSMIRPSEEFDNDWFGCLWTSFGEDGNYDYWTGYTNSTLEKYLDKHNLYIEPYDSGTMFVCPE